jgi:hypothetical protein
MEEMDYTSNLDEPIQCKTVIQAFEYLENSHANREEEEIVILPPDNVDEVTDEDAVNEEDIIDSNLPDAPGRIEIHSMTGRLQREAKNIANMNLSNKKAGNLNAHENKFKLKTKKQKEAKAETDETIHIQSLPQTSAQSSVKWRKTDHFKTRNATKIVKKSLIDEFPLLKTLNPYEIWKLFFTNDVLLLIKNETEMYANEKSRHSFSVTTQEIELFVAILLYSGYKTVPNERLYWTTDEDLSSDFISSKMSRNRYLNIKQSLHLAKNSALDKNDKFSKVRPLFDMLQANLIQFGVWSNMLSIDEQMIPYYGKFSCKMYMKNKPIKFGMKAWLLCSDDGYPFCIDLYQGKAQNAEKLPLGERVVMNLTRAIENPSDHMLYMDNFFSSTSLFRKLKEKGFRCTGTVRPNRIEKMPTFY